MSPLRPTGIEAVPIPCPHCDATQLYFAAVQVHPAEGGMDIHISMIEAEAHDHPTDGPQGVPTVSINLQCLDCGGWAFLALASGMDDGTWLKFRGYAPEPQQWKQ
jgi:hypothetical protein